MSLSGVDMEAFLSSPVSDASIAALRAACPVPLLFSAADSCSARGQLALDCLRRLFQGGVGMALLETEELAALLPDGLQAGNGAVKDVLLTILANLASSEAPRMRALLLDCGALKPAVSALADESTRYGPVPPHTGLQIRIGCRVPTVWYACQHFGGSAAVAAEAGAWAGRGRQRGVPHCPVWCWRPGRVGEVCQWNRASARRRVLCAAGNRRKAMLLPCHDPMSRWHLVV